MSMSNLGQFHEKNTVFVNNRLFLIKIQSKISSAHINTTFCLKWIYFHLFTNSP